jgi:glycerol-3-phosphate dehydrogenase
VQSSQQSLSAKMRQQNLDHMASDPFDVLVIGGGITGAGVALDAAVRGYRVALVEKQDFASGTSSKSTKLVHGGIRYLPNFDFALVHEALVERGLLLHNAPFLVHPLPFVLPIYKGDRHPVGMPFTTPGGIGLSKILNLGLWLYDTMAGRNNMFPHRHLSREEVMQEAPLLITKDLEEGFVYYDGQTHDARLTMAVLRTAANYGALIANYAEVTGFLTEEGQVQGARIHDRLAEREFPLRARYVVNATGIFAEQVEELIGLPTHVQVEPSKGVHLVFFRQDLQIGDSALVLPETDDRRILFIVPWGSRVLFGTTDTGSGDLDTPVTSHEDIEYLLHHLNRYLSVKLTTKNIISTYAGYRPLVRTRGGKDNARLSRTHAVLQSPSGLVTIVGGKLTTYRRMAQDTVDVLDRRDGRTPRHLTQRLPLQGSVGWQVTRPALQEHAAALGLSAETITHLDQSYGTEMKPLLQLIADDATLGQPLIADLPYIRAEVVHACREEMAMTPYDMLGRRTSITLEDRQRGLGIVDDVAALMAKELGWTATQQTSLVAAYRARVEQQVEAEQLLAH